MEDLETTGQESKGQWRSSLVRAAGLLMATGSLGHKAPRETTEDARRGDAEKGGTPGELGDSGAWWAERKHAEKTEPASSCAGRTEKARRSCEGRER